MTFYACKVNTGKNQQQELLRLYLTSTSDKNNLTVYEFPAQHIE